jgi:hypothetical protein
MQRCLGYEHVRIDVRKSVLLYADDHYPEDGFMQDGNDDFWSKRMWGVQTI